jgi:hypothetical protein
LKNSVFFWEEGLNRYCDEGVPVYNDNDERYDEDKEGGDIITEKFAKEEMRKVIREFFEICNNSQEVGSFDFKGYTIYLTGEISFGETTESLDIFQRFVYLPQKILEEAGIIWE